MIKLSETINQQLQNLRAVITTGGKSRLRRQFLPLHPRDQANFLMHQSESVRQMIYHQMSPAELAEILEHIEIRDRTTYFSEVSVDKAAATLAEMYVDDAVDIIQALHRSKPKDYLDQLEEDLANDIRELLHYKKETAGSIMTTEFIKTYPDQTAGEILEQLKTQATSAVTIYYVFVIDSAKRLSRVVSLKQLITARKDMLIGKIGTDKVVSVRAHDTKSEAARIMQDYNFIALPVVDDQEKMLGVITVDDILDVIESRATEHYSRLAAATDIELTDGPLTSARKRLPWLIMLLFLGMITATLIGQFEETIATIAILGAFIPVVAGTTGNSGTQSLAIMVRGIANGKLAEVSLRGYFLKELLTGLITSIVCGAVLLGIVFVWKQEFYIGLVAGGALMISIFAGSLVGSAVPLILRRLRIDPTVASGPLITTVCDIISMGIYFGFATLLMPYLV